MKLKRLVILLATLSVGVLSLGMATPVAAATLVPPFHQCPAIGADTSCAVLFVQNPDGSRDTLVDSSQLPFDFFVSATPEDTLIGFQNNGSSPVSSIPVSGIGSIPPFTFDGDGICNNTPGFSYGNWSGSGGCPYLDSTNRYGGPGVTFSNITNGGQNGTVNFNPAIPVGGSTYWSLEGPTSSIAPPTKASPTITTSASPTASQVVGTTFTVSDTATFQGTTSTAPTGSVSFTLFNSDCSASTGVSGSGGISTTSGVSTASFSGTFTPTAPGTYQWIASYAGDPNNNGFTTKCGDSGEQLTVIKAPLTITTSASPTASQVVGTTFTVSDTATFQGTTSTAPTGSVSFTLFNSDCSASTGVSGSGGISTTSGVSTASFSGTFTPTAPGTYQWIASYAGDPNNNGFTTKCGDSGEQLTVIKADLTITTSASPTASQVVGTTFAVSDTATFQGTTSTAPTGSVSFTLLNFDCSVSTGVSGSGSVSTTNGVSTASFSGSFAPTAPGTYQWIASYAGDANNNAFKIKCGDDGEQLTVIKASPRITTHATENGVVGGTVLDTATLSGGTAPTGSITFNLFGPNNPTCTLPAAFKSTTPVSGNGTYTSASFTPVLPGTYLWVATYSGDTNNNSATTACGDTGETSAVFSFAPGGGSFVIGDQNAAVGNSVTFWGAKWAKDNSLSGGSAPRSFKGFAENFTPSCGTGWTADPGNSTPPPDGPLPAYMAVIVTSSADKSGPTISGNTVHIVIVKTNPGYAPNPGHAGTGTVVAVVC